MCICLELKIWLPWKRDVTALELYCTYTNENSDNGNQKATSEYEFCTNAQGMREYTERTLKSETSLDLEKLNNSEILKPTTLCEGGLLFRFLVLD